MILIGFDTETTGRDPHTARLVQAALVTYDTTALPGQQITQTRTWLADPGVDIPADATAVHKITTAYARTHGVPADTVIKEVTAALVDALTEAAALVVYNAPYDLTLLDYEAMLYGLPTLTQALGRPVGPVLDPLVLDRVTDVRRKGSRKLEAVAAHHGVTLTGAHTAVADATAAVQVAAKLLTHPDLAPYSLTALHAAQIRWAAERAASYERYRRRTDPGFTIEQGWPTYPTS